MKILNADGTVVKKAEVVEVDQEYTLIVEDGAGPAFSIKGTASYPIYRRDDRTKHYLVGIDWLEVRSFKLNKAKE